MIFSEIYDNLICGKIIKHVDVYNKKFCQKLLFIF